MRALIAMIAMAIALPGISQPATAQPAASIPRTSEGRPDFQGTWLTGFMTPLERLDGINTLVVPEADAEAALVKLKEWYSEGEVYDPEADYNPAPSQIMRMNGELRSSLIVEPLDGQLPLTSLAQRVIDGMKRSYDNPEDRPATERCVEGMVMAPISTTFLIVPLLIVQTPDAFVMTMEDADQTRIAALTGPIPPDAVRTRHGYSRGRWDGDTLVIETSHLDIPTSTGIVFRSNGAPVTSDSKVVERFTLTDANTLLYQFTVEDASLYRSSWRAEYVMTRTDHVFIEYACHEGNYALTNILTAARLGRQNVKPD